MRKYLSVLLVALALPSSAQQVLTLDSCRAMALRNNKQMDVSRLKQDVAKNVRKSMRTKYLPHISALGTYQYTSEEVSILNNDQKTSLQNLGTGVVGGVKSGISGSLTSGLTQANSLLASLGIPAAAIAKLNTDFMATMNKDMGTAESYLNAEGQKIVDAFRTDTRHVWAGSIMALQPIFMGGSIIAMNKMATIAERMTENTASAQRQSVIYSVDVAYWQVVSLKHKKKLAESFLDVVKKLDSDVQKMIAEGVATRSDGLSVSVKVNEAEMAVQKVNDGLVLSKMLLCQMTGMPMDGNIILADEDAEDLTILTSTPTLTVEQAMENRPELKLLDNAVDMARQSTNLMKAGYMPQVLLMGGYAVSNPNVLNGFEKKWGGFWNVGVLMRVPLWNWGDTYYKVRATKSAAAIARLELAEVQEKVELQVNQVKFKAEEVNKRLVMALTSVEKANENLRSANLAFREGVATPTLVMEAQTAWLQAQSQKIDAQIDVRLTQIDLKKVGGTLDVE